METGDTVSTHTDYETLGFPSRKLHGKLIDLHVHLDGSLTVDTVKKLAHMQKIDLHQQSDAQLSEKLKAPKDCHDLNQYLERFEFPLMLMQTGAALEESCYSVLKEQHRQGLCYTELRFAPQLHIRGNLTQQEAVSWVLKGKQQAENDFGICCGIILCCMRGASNEEQNIETLKTAQQFLGNGVVAVDLAGAEKLFPTAGYADLFQTARQMGLPFTIHAGEADGPESIWKAVEYGAARIGHGIRAVEDPALMKELACLKIPLEICPTSNLNTKVVDRITDYPLREFMNYHVVITVNTDNMTVSDTSVLHELALLSDAFQVPEAAVYQFLLNAAQSIFAPDYVKKKLIEKILQ